MMLPTPWDALPLAAIADASARAERELGARVLVRGVITSVGGSPLRWPVGPPEATPEPERIAAATLDVEEMPERSRPVRRLYELVRPFWITDATGRVMVRLAERDRPELETHIDRPFVYGVDGGRMLYLRALREGDEVVVGGRLHRELASAEMAGYREVPAAVILVAALWDAPAWESLVAWRELPWHRKLSLLLRNR